MPMPELPTQELAGKLREHGSVVTVGNFDGQHKGHSKLFSIAIEEAAAKEHMSVALSFYPHPAYILKGSSDYRLITSYDERRRNIMAAGFDYFIEQPFDIEFARTAPVDFLRYLAEKLGCAGLVIGEDYRFGKDKAGSMSEYESFAYKLGMKVGIVPPVTVNGERVSSTAIKRFICNKEFDKANAFLGRYYSVCGTAEKGESADNGTGLCTASIIPPPEKLLPPDGRYIARILIHGGIYDGYANIKTDFSFGTEQRTVETFIMKLNKEIKGEEIEVEIIRFMQDGEKHPAESL